MAVGVGILLFLLTSFSDPGTVNAENVSEYLSAYPYDNIIFSEKECPTCKIPKWDFSTLIRISMSISFWSLKSWLKFLFPHSDRLGQSTVVYVIVVLLGLTIIVDGWFVYCIYSFLSFKVHRSSAVCTTKPWFCFNGVTLFFPFLQNNCIGERNTRYFMAFLIW